MKRLETTVAIGDRGRGRRAWMQQVAAVLAMFGPLVGCASFDEQALALGPDGAARTSAGLEPLPLMAPGKPDCRAARAGDLLINEVVTRPGDRDLDGDGLSNGRDELFELVSLVAEPVHVENIRVLYNQGLRGRIRKSPCIAPHTAAVLVGHTTGTFSVPAGAVRISVDRSLRLTDGGGRLALYDVKGAVICQVEVPAAKTVDSGCVNRASDGDKLAPMLPHALVASAGGSDWSPGTCANGQPFPSCMVASDGVGTERDERLDDADPTGDGERGARSE